MPGSDERFAIAMVARTLLVLFVCVASSAAEEPKVVSIRPPELGFFSKKVVYKGIPIKGHQDVSDAALLEAYKRVARVLGKLPIITKNLVAAEAEMHVIGKDQKTTDLPYMRHMKGKPYETAEGKWASIDEHPKGTAIGNLLAQVGEENLLKLDSDPYRDHRDICTHELGHMISNRGLPDSTREAIKEQFEKSTGAGLWKTAYAACNADEYFSELSMWYFDSRGDYGEIMPRPEEGRAWLAHYDPDAFALLDKIYSGKLKISRLDWEKTAALPASYEGEVRSLASDEPSKILLINHTAGDLAVFWLDFQGKRKPIFTLHPGERLSENTFATHPFLVAKPDGQAVAIFVAGKQNTKAVLK